MSRQHGSRSSKIDPLHPAFQYVPIFKMSLIFGVLCFTSRFTSFAREGLFASKVCATSDARSDPRWFLSASFLWITTLWDRSIIYHKQRCLGPLPIVELLKEVCTRCWLNALNQFEWKSECSSAVVSKQVAAFAGWELWIYVSDRPSHFWGAKTGGFAKMVLTGKETFLRVDEKIQNRVKHVGATTLEPHIVSLSL